MPKRVLARQDCCCCRPYFIGQLLNPSDPPDPPVLSEYCVQYGSYDDNIFFPCGENNGVNGVFDAGPICGSYLDIPDFVAAGNLFRYSVGGALGGFYIQVITPAANGLVPDFGYIEFDIFGTPSGPVPIGAIQESNCFLNCYTATFDVDDVAVNSFTDFIYNDMSVDMTGDVPFSDPGHDAWVMSQLAGWMEPSVIYEATYVGNTVTITITTIMTLISGHWGDGLINLGSFNFTPCT